MLFASDPCYGVAFTSLVTTDENSFQQTVRFYHQLGFRTVKDFNKFKNGENSILSIGTSDDSIREIWLESFKLSQIDSQGFRVPQQEASNKEQSQGALLKVRLVPESSLSKPLQASTLSTTYFTADLSTLEAEFNVKAEPSKVIPNCSIVTLTDPLNNVVSFTDFARPTDQEKTVRAAFQEASTPATPQAGSHNASQVDTLNLLKSSLEGTATPTTPTGSGAQGSPKEEDRRYDFWW